MHVIHLRWTGVVFERRILIPIELLSGSAGPDPLGLD